MSSDAVPHQSPGPAHTGITGCPWQSYRSCPDRACRFVVGDLAAGTTVGPIQQQEIGAVGEDYPHWGKQPRTNTAKRTAFKMLLGLALPLALAGCGTFGSPFCSEPTTVSPGGSPCYGLVPSPAAAPPAVGWPSTAATPGAPYDPSLLLLDQVEAISQRLDQVEQRLRPPVAPTTEPRRTP